MHDGDRNGTERSALAIRVDPRLPASPSEQIARAVRYAVASGHLRPGERLPSVRALAVDAVVNPNTVGKAWRDLERDGVLESRPGDGVFVALAAPDLCRIKRDAELREQLARWVDDARTAGLSQDEIEDWIDAALAERRRAGVRGGSR
jgi:GntR family transcriptional regulator